MVRWVFKIFLCFFSFWILSFVQIKKGEVGNNRGCLIKSMLSGGVYQEFSVAIDSSTGQLTGVYEYYDRWDEKTKAYADINLFYFSGHVGPDSIVHLLGGWPKTNQHINGVLKMSRSGNHNSFEIKLDNEPEGYNDISFQDGVTRELGLYKDWIEVRIVKSAKAHIYNTSDTSSIRKGYLIKDNIVKVISKANDNWVKVEFNPPASQNKSSLFWMKAQDLYSADMTKW